MIIDRIVIIDGDKSAVIGKDDFHISVVDGGYEIVILRETIDRAMKGLAK